MKLDIHPPPTVKTICFSSRGDISRWFCPGRQYYVVVGPTTDAKVNMTFSPNHTCLIFYPRTAESRWEWRCQVCDLTPYPPPPVGLEKHDPFAKHSVHVHGVRQSNPHQEVRPGSGEARVNSRGCCPVSCPRDCCFCVNFLPSRCIYGGNRWNIAHFLLQCAGASTPSKAYVASPMPLGTIPHSSTYLIDLMSLNSNLNISSHDGYTTGN
jgi:hypothetical protein